MSEEVTFEHRVRKHFSRLCNQLRPEHVFVSLSSILPDKEQEILRVSLKNEDEKGLLVYDMLTMVRKQDGWQSHVQYTLEECGDPALLQLMCLKDCQPLSEPAETDTTEEEMKSDTFSEADPTLDQTSSKMNSFGPSSAAHSNMPYIPNVLGGEETHGSILKTDTALETCQNGDYLVKKNERCPGPNIVPRDEEVNIFAKGYTSKRDILYENNVSGDALEAGTTYERNTANDDFTELKTSHCSIPESLVVTPLGPSAKTSEYTKRHEKVVSKLQRSKIPRPTHENKIKSHLRYRSEVESREQGTNTDLSFGSSGDASMPVTVEKIIATNVYMGNNSVKHVVKNRKAGKPRQTGRRNRRQSRVGRTGSVGFRPLYRPPPAPNLSDSGATWPGYTPPARL